MIDIIPFASSSKGNCYLLKQDSAYYLIECGVDKVTLIKYLNSSGIIVSDIQGCFISHEHLDHALSCRWANEYMPIYANEEVINKYELQGTILTHNHVLELNGMSVMPINVEHGKTQNTAFIFKDKDSRVMFATDLMKFTSDLSKVKLTALYIECNYNDYMLEDILENENEANEKFTRQINTHMSFNNLLEHLRKMDLSICKKIVLLHASKWCIDKKSVIAELENEFHIPTTFAKEK